MLVPPPTLSSVSQDSSPSMDAGRACQGHLVKLHPLNTSMSIPPFYGKRVRARKLVLCDSLYRNGKAVCPMQSVPAEATLCGKRRELYYAHLDATKCQQSGCFGLGIEIMLKEGPLMECRGKLHARLISQSVSPADSLIQRSSSKASDRSTGASSVPPEKPKLADRFRLRLQLHR